MTCTGKAGEEAKLTKIWKRSGTGRIDLDTAGAGDIVSVTGIPTASIADTICATSVDLPLAPGPIDPPTLRWALESAPFCAWKPFMGCREGYKTHVRLTHRHAWAQHDILAQ